MMARSAAPTDADLEAVEAFQAFLSWGETPTRPSEDRPPFNWPPAVFAYVYGDSRWCPPIGEM